MSMCQSRCLPSYFSIGLGCLTPLSTIFQLYIINVSFIGGETGVHVSDKTTDLPQVTDKLNHKMLCQYTWPLRQDLQRPAKSDDNALHNSC